MSGNSGTLESDLLAALSRADGWLDRIGRPPVAPEPGSSLAGDDRVTAPFHVSNAAVWALTSSVDHFHGVRCLLLESELVPNSAPFTLLRAASEVAATAVYLLAPHQRKERVFRRLSLRWAEVQDTEAARKITGETAATSLEEHKLRLRKMAEGAGLSADRVERVVARPAGFGKIVELAGQACFGEAGGVAQALWAVNSGVAHGRVWAQLATNEKGERIAGETSSLMRMESSTVMLSQFVQLTAFMIEHGWRLLDQRRTSHLD